jgi:hypothetical protein
MMALTFAPCKPLKTRRGGRGPKLTLCGTRRGGGRYSQKGAFVESETGWRYNGVMEYSDGWSFVCKLCGKKHEVPEEIAPYWKDAGTLTRVPSGEVALGCSENPGTAQYSFSDFTAFKVA